ncbi:MAG: DUF3857 domain-containing protein [Pseudomonadota bacterium]
MKNKTSAALLFLLTLLVFAPCAADSTKATPDSHTFQIEQLNLKASLDTSWRSRKLDALGYFHLLNSKAAAIAVRALPQFGSDWDLPGTSDELMEFIRMNSLASVRKRIAATYHGQPQSIDKLEYNELSGPALHFSSEKLDMVMWLVKTAENVYLIALSDGSKNSLERLDKMTGYAASLSEIVPGQKLKQPTVSLDLDQSGSPIQITGADYKFPQLKGFVNVPATEIGLAEDEDIFSLILLNILSNSLVMNTVYCEEFDAQQKDFIAKTDLTEATGSEITHDLFTSEQGEKLKIYRSEGVDKDFGMIYVVAAFKELENCSIFVSFLSSVPLFDTSRFVDVLNEIESAGLGEMELTSVANTEAMSQFYRGMGLLAGEDGLDELAFFRFAHRIYPSPETLAELLGYFNAKQKYSDGIRLIESANKSIRDSQDIVSWYAWMLSKSEQYVKAADQYKLLFQNGYVGDEDFFSLIDVLLSLEEYESIAKQIELHLDSITKRSTALGYLAKYAGIAGNKASVQFAVDLVNKEDRINSENMYDLLYGLFTIEEYEQVLALIESLIKKYEDHSLLWYYQGITYVDLKKYPEAKVALGRALELEPDSSTILQELDNLAYLEGAGNYNPDANQIEPVPLPVEVEKLIVETGVETQNYDAEYGYRIKGFSFKSEESLTTSMYGEVKINSVSGVERFKTLSFDFDESYEMIHVNYLQVFDQDKKLLGEFDPATSYIATSRDDTAADTDMTLHIPIPEIAQGVSIKYLVSLQTRNPVSRFPFHRSNFLYQDYTENSVVFVSGDTDRVSAQSGRKILHVDEENLKVWSETDNTVYRARDYLPEFETIANWLLLSDASENWKEIGGEYLEMIDEKLAIELSEGQIKAVFGESSGSKDKILRAAEYVQRNINYQAIEFGSRGLIPADAKTTIKRKFGDCKDHSVLLYKLLKSSGVEAKLALVSTEEQVFPNTPSLDQFNHMVVYVSDLGGGVFLDATEKGLAIAPNVPPSSIQGSKAFILDAEGSYFLDVPSIEGEHNRVDIERKVSRAENGLALNETVTVRGYLASSFRNFLINHQADDLDSVMQKQVSNFYPKASLTSFDYYGVENPSSPLILEMETHFPGNGQTSVIPVFFEKLYMNQTRYTDRKVGYEIDQPYQVRSQTTLAKDVILDNTLQTQKGSHSSLTWKLTRIDDNAFAYESNVERSKGDSSEYRMFVDEAENSLSALEQAVIN